MRNLNIVFFILLAASCSTPKTFITNSQPETHEIIAPPAFLFEQSKEATWNNLLTLFASSDFRIDRINMNANMVILRYTNQPDLYIDCGMKKVSTEDNNINITNSKRHYSYRAYQYIHLLTYSIENNFTAYVNLLVTGDSLSSRVSVQFDFELETKEDLTTTRGTRYRTNRQEKLKISPDKPTLSKLFNTNCRSTGKLERQVVNMILPMNNRKARK